VLGTDLALVVETAFPRLIVPRSQAAGFARVPAPGICRKAQHVTSLGIVRCSCGPGAEEPQERCHPSDLRDNCLSREKYDPPVDWPRSSEELVAEQRRLAEADAGCWTPPAGRWAIGGCFVCSGRGKEGAGAHGDPEWAGAALVEPDGRVVTAVVAGQAGAPYEAGLLALREGAVLEAAVRGLPQAPAVLLVDATGRDHPRRAGLALHLGAMLGLPTVGVTHRPLLADGEWPAARRGERSPLRLAGELVGYWLVTREGARPLAVHAAWRTDPEIAVRVVLAASDGPARTPEPLRQARRVARLARAVAEGRVSPV
jgi:deoxyribonuclease V